MKGRERDINIIIEVSFKPFKRIREIFSLKNIVDIQTINEIIAHIL